MIDELKSKLIALGLDASLADSAIATVAEFAKSKLPESLHSSIDSALAGQTPEIGQLGSVMDTIKGFFK